MLRLKNIVLCIISSMTIGLHAINSDLTKFNKAAIFASYKLGKIDVYHGSDGFYVCKDDKP